jgi:hypothetical protein
MGSCGTPELCTLLKGEMAGTSTVCLVPMT